MMLEKIARECFNYLDELEKSNNLNMKYIPEQIAIGFSGLTLKQRQLISYEWLKEYLKTRRTKITQ